MGESLIPREVPTAAESRLDAVVLRRLVLSWWESHGRHGIPWKRLPDGRRPGDGEPLDPYAIWVAEVMLQQTQLTVMLPFWRRWMAALPSLTALAAAENHDVLMLWQGLGYYARARRLQQGARQLLAARVPGSGLASGDPWPRDLAGWLALPGIGPSTAGGILSSAFDQPFAILDGNVKRVLARLVASPLPPQRDLAGFWRLSGSLLDPRRPRAFNQALMDLGATVCTPRQPGCGLCPWQGHCAAYTAGDSGSYPVKDAIRSVPHQVIGVGVVLDPDGRVLIDQRQAEGLLGGLWEFPGGKQEPGESIVTTIERELAEELAIQVVVGEELISMEHSYSHKRLRFVVHLCRWLSGDPRPLASQQVRWVAPERLQEFHFPAANARMIQALQERLGLAKVDRLKGSVGPAGQDAPPGDAAAPPARRAQAAG